MGAQEDDIIDAAISFDGTWARRGFSSLYGVQAIVLEGNVIDFNLFSSYCKACQKMDESRYLHIFIKLLYVIFDYGKELTKIAKSMCSG